MMEALEPGQQCSTCHHAFGVNEAYAMRTHEVAEGDLPIFPLLCVHCARAEGIDPHQCGFSWVDPDYDVGVRCSYFALEGSTRCAEHQPSDIWHGWRINADTAFHVGPLPGRRSIAIYQVRGSVVHVLAYCKGEKEARQIMRLIDRLSERHG